MMLDVDGSWVMEASRHERLRVLAADTTVAGDGQRRCGRIGGDEELRRAWMRFDATYAWKRTKRDTACGFG